MTTPISTVVVCIGFTLVVVTVAAYAPVAGCDFISFDDPVYVSQNVNVLSGISLSGLKYAFSTRDGGNWNPLTWISLQLDGNVWGTNPIGYHLTNLILHTLNGILLFNVLVRMTGGIYQSGAVAALFALHPLHVESVAWIPERKDVLSTFLLLLTIAAYARYAARPATRAYLIVVILFVAGLLAKPMLVTLPILLFLVDIWPLCRVEWNGVNGATCEIPRQSVRFLVLEKTPLFVIAFCDGLVTIAAQHNATHWLSGLPFDVRMANAIHAVLWYLQKTFLPVDLTIFYPHPEQDLSWARVVSAVAIIGAISIYALWNVRVRPHVFVGWSWFLISLLPVIGLLQVGGQAYADRYAYVPHIGLFIFLVWEVHRWLGNTIAAKIAQGMIASAVFTLCAVLTHSQVGYWKNNVTLWTHALAVDPNNYTALFHLADYRLNAGDYDGAATLLANGLQTRRGAESAVAHYGLGRCLVALKHRAEAEQQFLAALQIDPYHLQSLDELAKLLRSEGRQAEAARIESRYESALKESVSHFGMDGSTQLRLGLLLARQGKVEQAVPHFEAATRLIPSAAAHNNLGLALEYLHQPQKAKINYLRAVELNPELAVAHFNLGKCLEAENDLSGAIMHFSEALRLNPGDSEAEQHLTRLKPGSPPLDSR